MYEIDITLIGNVCSEVRHMVTENGISVASFRVASTPRRFRGGRWADGVTTYASVTCWRTMADNVASSMGIGDPVLVQGRMTMRAWEKDTRSGQTIEIDAYAVGHDLRWGTSAFQRVSKKEPEAADPETLAAELATSFEREEAAEVIAQGAAAHAGLDVAGVGPESTDEGDRALPPDDEVGESDRTGRHDGSHGELRAEVAA
jgi:single-strand DNA-binding protein